MWPAPSALSMDNLSEVSTGTGQTGSTSGRSGHSENLEELRAFLGLAEDEEIFSDRFRIDRKKLEEMIMNDNESLDKTHAYFQKIMDMSGTHVAWPSRLKIGAKTKKDPHVRVAGRTTSDVNIAKENILLHLGVRNKQVTLKVNVSYTHHSHIIGEGGQTITRVRQTTGCHIHFPDSNRSFSEMKSNQVSITGSMEGVEQARRQVRDLVPLVFCFELPVLGSAQSLTEPLSPYIVEISEIYHVHVSYRTRSRFHATLVVIKGREWEVDKVKEATKLIMQHLCGDMTEQIPVQMTMEISPHHHSTVLGPGSAYLKAIMEATQTQILFPDASDPNIPILKKSNVTITGKINDVYLARQQLMGSLPITLIFTLTDSKDPLDPKQINEISERLDVGISTRQCPKQNSISVIVRGVERNTSNVYEARRILLKLEGKVKAYIPPTYYMPNAPRIFEKTSEPSVNLNKNRSLPSFRLPEIRPSYPVENSPIMLSPVPMWNFPVWNSLVVQQQQFLPGQQPFLMQRPSMTALPLNRDVTANSSGYGSTFNSMSPTFEYPRFSSLSSTTSSLSPTAGVSPSTPPGFEGHFPNKEQGLKEWGDISSGNLPPPADYESKKKLALKAFQNKPTGVEWRTPTPTWSGYGFSLSSPTGPSKDDIFGRKNDAFDIWKNTKSPEATTQAMPFYNPVFDIDNSFFSASNHLETIPPGIINQIHSFKGDLATLLTSIGLDKYIHLFSAHEIDIETFKMLTDANLRELGVLAYGPRHKMLLAIAELKKRASPLLNAAPGAERKRFAQNPWGNTQNQL